MKCINVRNVVFDGTNLLYVGDDGNCYLLPCPQTQSQAGFGGAGGGGGGSRRGLPGTNGDFVRVTPEPPGVNCPNGGDKIEVISGLDGVTVLSTTYVCNGGAASSCTLQQCNFDVSCGGKFPCPTNTSPPIVVTNSVQLQAAITAAISGTTILVAPGTYTGPFTVTGKTNLIIQSQIPFAATLAAPAGSNVLTITGTSMCVQVLDFSMVANLQDRAIVVINTSSAVISNNNITFNGLLNSLQVGGGINVDSGSAAMIIGNTITGYQKTGIRVNGDGTCASVVSNIVTGLGATPVLAQNGIQISRGADALVQNNTITKNLYTGIFPDTSAGILLFQEPSTAFPLLPVDVCVQYNSSQQNDVGLGLDTVKGILIQKNTLSNNIGDNNGYGILVSSNSAQNTFIQNTALNNLTFDIEDDSIGLASAGTANIWLCNMCMNDNKGGAICASTTNNPFPT